MNIIAIAVLAAALFSPHQQNATLPESSPNLVIATVSGSAGSLSGYKF